MTLEQGRNGTVLDHINQDQKIFLKAQIVNVTCLAGEITSFAMTQFAI